MADPNGADSYTKLQFIVVALVLFERCFLQDRIIYIVIHMCVPSILE